MQQILKALREIVGPDNFFDSPADKIASISRPFVPQATESDALPLAVARPAHTGQLRELLLFCHGHNLPVSVRGAGMSTRAMENTGGALIILTTGLDRIVELDHRARQAIVQAGVTGQALNQAAARQGLFYPPAPINASTLGGQAAVNAAGPRAFKYGPTVNFIRDLNIFFANGECHVFASQNAQPGNPSVLPWAALFCGSPITMGVISQLTLQLLPLPETSSALAAFFPAPAAAAAAVMAILDSPLLPAAMEIAGGRTGSIFTPDMKNACLLFLEFAGHAAEVTRDVELAKSLLAHNSAKLMESSDIDAYTRQINSLVVTTGNTGKKIIPETIACPPNRLPSLVDSLEELSCRHGIDITFYGHAGIATLQVILAGDAAPLASAAQELFTLELVLNNSVKSETDTGLTRQVWLHKHASPFCRQVAGLFDPEGIFSGVK